jgi:hypothetical protein
MSSKISLEIVNFKQELARVEREVQQLANVDIKKKVTFAVETLKVVTPVDTGEARSGWEDRTYMGLDGYLDGTILNRVEHVEYLNRGHSQQAPAFFVEQVLIKIGVLKPF